jgi:hypothetical protein
MYFFPIQIKENNVRNDNENTKKLNVQVHGKKNRKILLILIYGKNKLISNQRIL